MWTGVELFSLGELKSILAHTHPAAFALIVTTLQTAAFCWVHSLFKMHLVLLWVNSLCKTCTVKRERMSSLWCKLLMGSEGVMGCVSGTSGTNVLALAHTHTHNFYSNTTHTRRTHPCYLSTGFSAPQDRCSAVEAVQTWDRVGTELRSRPWQIGQPVSVWVPLAAPSLARTPSLAGGRQAALSLFKQLESLTDCFCLHSQHNPVLNRESLLLDWCFIPIFLPNRTLMVALLQRDDRLELG